MDDQQGAEPWQHASRETTQQVREFLDREDALRQSQEDQRNNFARAASHQEHQHQHQPSYTPYQAQSYPYPGEGYPGYASAEGFPATYQPPLPSTSFHPHSYPPAALVLGQSPTSYMTIDDQLSPTKRQAADVATAGPPRTASSGTGGRTSFSTDHGSTPGNNKSSGKSSGNASAATAAKDQHLVALDGDDEGDGKKKRKRVERACYTCRQKRSKCDGQQPCALCVHNKLECVYPPPTRKVTIKYVEELEAKLAALDGSSSRNPSTAALAADQTAQLSGAPKGGSAATGSGSRALLNSFEHSPAHAPNPQSQPHSPKAGRLGLLGANRRASDDAPPKRPPTSTFSRPASDPSHPTYPPPSILPPGSQPEAPMYGGGGGSIALYGGSQGQPSHEASGSGAGAGQPYTASYDQYGQPVGDPFQQQQQQQQQWPQYPSTRSSYSRPGAPESSPETMTAHLPATVQEKLRMRTPTLPPAPELGSVHANFSPGADTSSAEGDADDGDHRRLLGDNSRWERQGRDGRQTELVEKGAARLAGEEFKPSAQAYQPGLPIDDFVTQALAPAASYEEMYELPEPALAAELLTFYEERIHWLFPVIHYPSLLKKYKHICEVGKDATHQYSTKEQIDLATTNLLFAITCAIRSADGDAPLIGLFFKRSQALTSGSTVLLLANVDIINYLNLLSMFSQSCSKGNLSSNATGLAVNMSRGLQLDNPKVNGTFDPFTKMLRQRAWAGCLVMEPTSSVMLYRMTGTLDADFRDQCLPEPIDDESVRDDGTIIARDPNELRKIDYFIFLSRLMSVKASILRDVYNLAQRPTFPDAHQVLKLEDRLFAWRKDLPAHLSNPKDAPAHGPFRDQALKLQLRYANVRVLLYRPFLYHFCMTPGGTYPVPNSLKFELARKSAHVCQEAAIEVLETIHSQWNTSWAGWWWWSLAFVYCASLATLAHRIMDATYPEPETPYYEKLSVAALDKALDMLLVLGWKAEGGIETNDEDRRRIHPPKSLLSTARRCYRIISSIDKSIRRPYNNESNPQTDAEPKVTSKQADPYRNMPVPPGRYSRNPDHSLPPLRLSNTSPTYSDDNFIRNWVNLMPPAHRSPTFVPADFTAPVAPFDMSVRQENPEAAVSDKAWQDWASLLGTGYLSNLGVSISDADDGGGAGAGVGGVGRGDLNVTSTAAGSTHIHGGHGSSLLGENIWAATGDDRADGQVSQVAEDGARFEAQDGAVKDGADGKDLPMDDVDA